MDEGVKSSDFAGDRRMIMTVKFIRSAKMGELEETGKPVLKVVSYK
jgi:hypothetical protein